MSLRARILLLALLATLLPALAILWLLFEYRMATVVEAREQLVARAGVIAEDLDDKIAGTVQLLFGLSQVPVLGTGDRAACSGFLADVLKEHPQYTGLLTITPDGQLFCDSLHSGRRLDLNDRRYVQQARQSRHAVVEPAIGRLTGKGVLQIAYSVRDPAGGLRFILLASLDMDAYGRAKVASLPYRRVHFQVWNNDGSIVMDHPGPASSKMQIGSEQRQFMLVSTAQAAGTLGSGSQATIWAKSALPEPHHAGLRLALSVPESELLERIDRQFRHALIGLGTLALMIFLVAAVLGEFAVRRQTVRLMKAISRLDSGTYHLPIGRPYPRGELGEVMRALDRMASSLEQQRQDIQRYTEALEQQARVDALTNLANRHHLGDRLAQALDEAHRNHRIAAVLMLDLDRFKTVNDSLGHSQGDILLKQVAGRLQGCVRDGDTIARIGGDEFVVVLANMGHADDVVPVAQKILLALAQPVEVGAQLLTVSSSLGIAIYPRDGKTADALLQYADTAMYSAKADGGNAMAFFTPEMRQAMVDRLQIEAGLRQALAADGLCLHYQPIVDTASGRIVAAEALVRWQHPQRGLVSPMYFIPIAEETGLIIPLGEWVLRQACTAARAWRDGGLGEIPVAVNLSARQFSAPGLADTVEEILRTSQCPASLLHLEITESSVMDQVEPALETMARLTALGVRLTIDDFGTGYSSLSQLKRLPVAALKIDRTFVRDISIDASDDVLIDAIIALAKKLSLQTVAEGVETQVQVDFLGTRGCDALQGYFFARPCESDAFVHIVRQRNGPAAAG